MDSNFIMVMGVALLVAFAVGGMAYVLIYPFLSGEKKAEKRRKAYRAKDIPDKKNKLNEVDKRRKQIGETLKQLEEKRKDKVRITIAMRIRQAGLSISPLIFYLYSVASGLMLGIGSLVLGAPWQIAGAIAFAAFAGLPRFALRFIKNRRDHKFLNEFPNTIDVIVRGVKSGLPLNDCLKMIAIEAPEPVGPEFRKLVESQKMGVTIDQGMKRLHDNVPLQEVNFLAVVLGIQSKAGGNLSEALGNLSRVLRERKKMKAKIRAVSAEAKTGAAIIGSLPVVILLVVNIITPDYMTPLFVTTLGNFLLGISVFWMSLGVFVMKQMINFDI